MEIRLQVKVGSEGLYVRRAEEEDRGWSKKGMIVGGKLKEILVDVPCSHLVSKKIKIKRKESLN